MAVGSTRVVQITNIAPQATKDQMQTLFGFLGKIEDIRLYPTIRDVSCPVQSRICYVKFIDHSTVAIAQHLTNTVFIDRALIVIPVANGEIPDEYFALEMTNNGTIVPGLYPVEPKLPANVVNSVSGIGIEQVIQTNDPQLETNNLLPYPPLPANTDSRKIEEIRRTVMVQNYEPTGNGEAVNEFFSSVGEIKYMRPCFRTCDGSKHTLIEFSEQPSVIEALKLNGKDFNGKPIVVQHAIQSVIKPQAKSNEAAQREIEEAMTRVKEAQTLISAAIDPVIGMLSKDKRSGSRRSRSRSRGRRRRSRSRSRSRRRSHSRHRSRRSRSRSKRSRSRDRDRKRRSKSRSRRHSRSRSKSRRRSPRRSRSKSRSKSNRKDKDKERDRSKDRKKQRDGSADAEVEKKSSRDAKRRSRSKHRSKSRDRKRSRSKDKKNKRKSSSPKSSKKRSRSKSRDKEDRKEKEREKDRDRDRKKEKKDKEESEPKAKVPRNYDEEEKGFDSEKEREVKQSPVDESSQDSQTKPEESSEKSDNMDISNSP